MASDSQTLTSPSTSAGTFPVPEILASRGLKSGSSNEITVSSNGIFFTFIAIHGRIDQDE